MIATGDEENVNSAEYLLLDKHTHSTAVPTSKSSVLILPLPVEILQAIFMIYVERAFKELSNHDLTQAMLYLTHVCSPWRHAALGFHQMWFPVSFTRGGNWELANLFLERGASTPLRLSNLRERGGFSVPPRLKLHSFRLEEIRIFTSEFECVLKDIGEEFPGLVYLFVTCRRNNIHSFTVNALGLQHLHLEGVHISSLAQFKDLTYLHLQSMHGPLSTEDVCALILRSPRLRFLNLNGLDRFAPSSSRDWKFYLPDLHYVNLAYADNEKNSLYKSILPWVGRTTELDIVHVAEQSDSEPLLKLVAENLWIFQSPQELACTVRDVRTHGILRIDTIPKSRASVTITLRLAWDQSFENLLTSHIDLSRVTDLTIGSEDPGYLALLRKNPRLKRLSICYDDPVDYLYIQDGLANPLACANLEVLRIALTKVPTVNSLLRWMDILLSRVQSGCTTLHSLLFYVYDLEDYEAVDFPYVVSVEPPRVLPYLDFFRGV